MKFIKILIILVLFSPLFLRGEEKVEEAPSALIIFGATGDLSSRKLFPAIYQLALHREFPEKMAIVGMANTAYTDETFREKAATFIGHKEEAIWNRLEQQMFYVSGTFDKDASYEKLKEKLQKINPKNRVYYLSTHTDYFPVIVEQLKRHGLITPDSKVVLEKPFGTDLDSALALQEKISQHVDEEQIYRVDHYLGKVGVQNILKFRFENALFEPVWRKEHIDHVQITLSEEIGVGTRAQLWEATGTLRDVVQNHVIQLMALVAMDLPDELEAKKIQEEKIKILQAARYTSAVRGQYGAGEIRGKEVVGYRQEPGVPESSNMETFAAAQIFLDLDRWEGVPFSVRGGKRLAKQVTEIVITFKKIAPDQIPDALFIRVQPEPGIYFRCQGELHDLGYHHSSPPEAYEKILAGAIQGDKTLFVVAEEQLAAWRLFSPLLQEWEKPPAGPFPNYEAGTWGPPDADELLTDAGQEWLLSNS